MVDFTDEAGSRTSAPVVEPASPPGIDHLELIARGGFATVYRGWQPAFNRWVAVKYLAGQHGSSPVYRFDQEARAVGSLSEHPHVVPVYDAGEIGGFPYLVMPYLTGGSLHDRIAAGPVGPDEALATGQAVADALAEAHRLGILHRDIKPANILFTAFGVPQLADFGVARLSDSTLTGGLLAVTVSYAAPEVLSGERATHVSDVYSLGATLYAALRGAPPFGGAEGELAVAQAMRVVREEPAPLTSFGVAGPIAAVVDRAMAKDPNERYGSAAEFRDALATVQTTPVGARPPTAPDTVPVPAATPPSAPAATPPSAPAPAAPPSSGHRHRTVLIAAVAAIALAGAGTGIGLASAGGSHAGRHGVAARLPAGAARPTSTTTHPDAGGSNPPTSGLGSAPDAPPSAGGAAAAAQIPASTLADTITSYYGLVNQHLLDKSWQWLSPDFQARIGQAYYRQFWDSISHVQVLSVQVTGGVAKLTLRYTSVQGSTSVEAANLGFAIDRGHILIDSDQVTHG